MLIYCWLCDCSWRGSWIVFYVDIQSIMLILLILPHSVGAWASTTSLTCALGHWGRGSCPPDPRKLPLKAPHSGQLGPAQSAQQLPACRHPWHFFSQRQGRETYHGTYLFPISGESCHPLWTFTHTNSNSTTLHLVHLCSIFPLQDSVGEYFIKSYLCKSMSYLLGSTFYCYCYSHSHLQKKKCFIDAAPSFCAWLLAGYWASF